MKWGQSNVPSMQGIQNGHTFSQNQGQSMHMMGYVPRQLEQSLHGTPVSNRMEYLNHYLQLQGISRDIKSVELMENTGETHTESTSKQSFSFDYLQNGRHNSPNEGYSGDTMLLGRKDTLGKSMFSNNVVQGTKNDIVSGNIQQLYHSTEGVHFQEFQNGQEHTDWLVRSHGNIPANIVPSRGATSLDPIEEKILFGDDGDANWDAISGGRSNRLVEAYLDYPIPNNDFIDVYPSHPSGTWSALMKEALEVSGSDTDQHEDWSGLGIPNTESPASNPVFLSDRRKQDAINDGSFNLHNASLTSKPFQLFTEANVSANCHSVLGSEQPIKIPYEQGEKLCSVQQISKETSGILFAENHQPYNFIGSSFQERQEMQLSTPNDVWEVPIQPQTMHFMESSENRLNLPEMQHSWIHQQKMRYHNINNQSSNEIGGWEVELPPASESCIFKKCDDMNQYAQRNDATTMMHQELSQTRSMGKFDGSKDMSLSSLGGTEFVKSETNGLKISGDHHYGANLADFINSNSFGSNTLTNEHVQSNNHQLNPVKYDTDYLFLKDKKDDLVNDHKQINISPQGWDSSSGCMNRKSGETCAFGHLQPTHKTNDGQSERDNSLLPENENLGLISIGQKPSSQPDEVPLSYKRFSFHPAENLACQSNYKSYSQVPYHPIDWGLNAEEKEHLGNSQMKKHNQLDTVQRSGLKLGPLSQKVCDHSFTIHNSTQRVNNFNPRNIELVAEASCLWPSPATVVEALPTSHEGSQRNFLDNKPVISASTSKEAICSDIESNSFGMMNQSSHSIARKQNQQQQNNLSYESTQVQYVDVDDHFKHDTVKEQVSRDSRCLAVQTSEALFPHLPGRDDSSRISSMSSNRAPVTSEFHTEDRGQSEMVNASSNQTKISQRQLDVEKASTNLVSTTSVVNQDGLSNLFNNVWRNASSHHLSELQPQKFAPSFIQSNSYQPSPQEDGQIAKVEIASSERDVCLIGSQQLNYRELPSIDTNYEEKHSMGKKASARVVITSQMEEQNSRNISTHNSGIPSSSLLHLHEQDNKKGVFKSTDNQRDKINFPTVFPTHSGLQKYNYSLLQQMQAVKRTDYDPCSVVDGKSLKGTESNADASRVECAERERYICEHDVASKESNSASRENVEESANASHLHVGGLASHMPTFSPNIQMAPSLFELYRAYKENQTSNGLGSQSASTVFQSYFSSKSFEPVDNAAMVKRRDDSISDIASVALVTDHDLSPCLKVKLTDDSLFLSRKKRKIVTSDLLPWHKEITQSYLSLKSFSTGKVEWAQATNRLIEKDEDDIETEDDVPESILTKKRLILTTQLMQQIFPPVDAKLLLSDARTSYEKVIYYMTKLMLGKVCSLISVFQNDSYTQLECGSMISEKHNTSKKMREEFFLKIAENSIAILRKLQSNFSRWDCGSLNFDARMECQDLQQGFIINRFAKFHVGSSTSVTSVRRSFPQRIATAVPMPRNIPDRVICYSL